MKVVRHLFPTPPAPSLARRVARRALLVTAMALAEYYGLPAMLLSKDSFWGYLSVFKPRRAEAEGPADGTDAG